MAIVDYYCFLFRKGACVTQGNDKSISSGMILDDVLVEMNSISSILEQAKLKSKYEIYLIPFREINLEKVSTRSTYFTTGYRNS